MTQEAPAATETRTPIFRVEDVEKRYQMGDVTVRWRRHMKECALTRQIIETGRAFVLPDIDARAGAADENLRRAGVKSFAGMPIPGAPHNQGVL